MNKKIIMSLFIVVSLTVSGFCQTSIKTGWWIFRRLQSTKPKSITAVAAVRGDLSGMLYNPSVLATITQNEIFFYQNLDLLMINLVDYSMAYHLIFLKALD